MLGNEQSTATLYHQLQRLHLQQSVLPPGVAPAALRSGPAANIQQNSASYGLSSQSRSSPPYHAPTQSYHVPILPLSHSKSAESNALLPHQRGSPPPGFQNLHMIKEDSVDGSDHSHMEDDSAVGDSGAKTTEADLDAANRTEQDRSPACNKYAQTPQISITDTAGHVTAVSHSPDVDGDVMVMDDGDHEEKVKVTSTSTRSPPMGPPVETGMAPLFPYSWFTHLGGYSLPSQFPATALPNLTRLPDVDSAQLNFTALSQGLILGMGLDQFSFGKGIDSVAPLASGSQQASSVGWSYDTNVFPNSSHPTSNKLADMHQLSSSLDGDIAKHSWINQSARDDNHIRNGLPEVQPQLWSLANSKRTMSDLILQIKQVLDTRSAEIRYDYLDNRFRLTNSTVQMEMEVCQGGSERQLKVRWISGDELHISRLCSELLQGMNL